MISEMQKDDRVVGFFAVKDITEKETKALKKYLDLNLVDASGQINAKVWELTDALVGDRPQMGVRP